MSLSGRTVLLKTTFLDSPHTAKVVDEDGSGIWVESLELAAAIQRTAAGGGHAAIPKDKQFLSGYSVLFIPFSNVEWAASK